MKKTNPKKRVAGNKIHLNSITSSKNPKDVNCVNEHMTRHLFSFSSQNIYIFFLLNVRNGRIFLPSAKVDTRQTKFSSFFVVVGFEIDVIEIIKPQTNEKAREKNKAGVVVVYVVRRRWGEL